MFYQSSTTSREGRVDWRRQWRSLKRQEKSALFFQVSASFLNFLLWLVWIFFVAPYPITIRVPFVHFLERISWAQDYLWPFSITVFLILNLCLFHRLYRKDIFAAWIILGSNLMIQFFALVVGVYLGLL